MSSSSAYSLVSREELFLFHAIDRRLYTILTIDLWRDPMDSMKTIALLLWLERGGFRNVVKKVLLLPYTVINELIDETTICLNCIGGDISFESYDIPLIQSLTDPEISIRFFQDSCHAIALEISKILHEICVRAFTDIFQQATQRNIVETQSLLLQRFNTPIGQPGVTQACSLLQQNEVPPYDRTMFVTFSKGYPVADWEIRGFFTEAHGDCIETLYMQQVPMGEQPLFARIVFRSALTIQLILSETNKVKFTINGKHVWARKYVPRRVTSSSSHSPSHC